MTRSPIGRDSAPIAQPAPADPKTLERLLAEFAPGTPQRGVAAQLAQFLVTVLSWKSRRSPLPHATTMTPRGAHCRELAPIRYALPLLQRERLSQPAGRAVGVIDRQVDHLTRLVDDLLDVSRITRGKIELRRENWQPPMTLRPGGEAGYSL